MCDYPFFIPQVVLFANSSLFWFKVTNEHREFRNYLFRICYAMFSSRKKEEKRKNFLPLKKHYLMLGQSEGISVGIIREILFR